jgi:hypothetical protein
MCPPQPADSVERVRPRAITRVALAAPAALALAALAGCDLGHSWHWKSADLDRNRLNLALHRGADSGPDLATWVDNGAVVHASGTTSRGEGGDAEVVIRYDNAETDWAGAQRGVESVCYRFMTGDGYEVEFWRTDCPGRTNASSASR